MKNMVFKKGNIPFMKGKRHSEKSIEKMSDSHRLNPTNYWLGKKRSEETNEKIRLKHIGKKASEATRLKMSFAQQSLTDNAGRFKKGQPPINYWTGRKMSEVTKEQMSMAHKKNPTKYWLGKRHPINEDTKKKISESHIGITHPTSEETKEKIRKIWSTPERREFARTRRLNTIIPSKDTSIERKMQDELASRGIGFYKHYPMIGQPDIAFPDRKVAVFADGDYWHGKREGKKESDSRINEKLRNKGFLVLRYWEHEINANVEEVVDEIEEVLLKTRGDEVEKVG